MKPRHLSRTIRGGKPGVGTILLAALAFACQAPGPRQETPDSPASSRILADVVSVEASGEPGGYRFEVGVRSPDEGCRQYADWWEVVGIDGELIHRRVLGHSHIAEQPFVRGSKGVQVAADTVVWVRAHMHPTGYGGTAFRGSVQEGFSAAELAASFAAELQGQPPAPPECAN